MAVGAFRAPVIRGVCGAALLLTGNGSATKRGAAPPRESGCVAPHLVALRGAAYAARDGRPRRSCSADLASAHGHLRHGGGANLRRNVGRSGPPMTSRLAGAQSMCPLQQAVCNRPNFSPLGSSPVAGGFVQICFRRTHAQPYHRVSRALPINLAGWTTPPSPSSPRSVSARCSSRSPTSCPTLKR